MKVEVELFATLAIYLPAEEKGGSALIEVPDGSSVSQVIQRLGIPDEIPRVVLINGLDGGSEQSLFHGDTLSVFPPLAGGA